MTLNSAEAADQAEAEPRIRLLALDLDGTLFGDDLLISERTRAAIAAAQAEGVRVTIATGRMFRSARQIAGDLSIAGPIICYQGALVQDVTTEEVLLHETVPLQEALRVIGECRRQGLHLNLYLGDRLFVEKHNRHANFYARINLGLEITEVGPLDRWLEDQGGKEPTKLVIVTDPEQTDSVLEGFTATFAERLQVTKSHARFTEFTNKVCSKGRALSLLAAHHGISRQEVMAIGDGLNDLDMICWAGYGVAVSSGPDALRAAARLVCAPLSEDGVAQTIARYVLRSEFA